MKKLLLSTVLLMVLCSTAIAGEPSVFISQDSLYELQFLHPLPIVALCYENMYVAGFYWYEDNVFTVNFVGTEVQFRYRDNKLWLGNYWFKPAEER